MNKLSPTFLLLCSVLAALGGMLVIGCSHSEPTTKTAPTLTINAPTSVEAPETIEVEEEIVEEEEVEEIEVAEADTVESAFDSNQWNSAVGLGGGANAAWGNRRNPRNRAIPSMAPGTESYSQVVENAFKSAVEAPVSTFGVDVDLASYTNIRRLLNYGQLPPPAAVRVEEMINYFSYAYAPPTGKDTFRVTFEKNTCPWNPDHELVLVGLKGRDLAPEKTPPRNLVFLIDVSGSMTRPNKLPLVKRSLRGMLKGLTKHDTVAVVTYAGNDTVALLPTSCADKPRIAACLKNLGGGGGTNGAGGIRRAYELARQSFAKEHVNRVILVTDGDFNVGVTSEKALRDLIEKERESGVYLTVVGVGSGNLGDSRMSMLAKHGNGQYIYLDSDREARYQFGKRLLGNLVPIAKDVKLQVEFNPERVAGYRLIGYERRVMKKEEFRDDKKDSGEVGSGHTVTALYEIVPSGREVPGHADRKVATADSRIGSALMEVRLRHKAPWAKVAKETSYRLPERARPSANFEIASTVAMFGMVLGDSAHRGSANLTRVAHECQEWTGESQTEFRQLVRKALAIQQSAERTAMRHRNARFDRGQLRRSDALQFLARQQQEDGSFRSEAACQVADVGLTGLAMLAFLGDGTTLRSGPFKTPLKNATKWLRRHQLESGLFTSEESKGSYLDHTIAAFAMCEAYGLSKYKIVKKNALLARAYLLANVKPGTLTHGWRLLANEALGHASLGRIDGALLAAELRTPASPAGKHAAAAIDFLQSALLGQSKNRLTPKLEKATTTSITAAAPKALAENGPDAAACYFHALAMHRIGGTAETTWRDTILPRLGARQTTDGSFSGNPDTQANRIYTTALMVMCLTSKRDGRVGP